MRTFVLSILFLAVCLPCPSQENPLTCLERRRETFFPYAVVAAGLSLNRIEESRWTPIILELQRRGNEIPRLMRDRARLITPNPFIYPYNGAVAKKLWLQMMKALFVQTMQDYYIYNPSIVENVYNYLLTEHLQSFDDCFGSELEE